MPVHAEVMRRGITWDMVDVHNKIATLYMEELNKQVADAQRYNKVTIAQCKLADVEIMSIIDKDHPSLGLWAFGSWIRSINWAVTCLTNHSSNLSIEHSRDRSAPGQHQSNIHQMPIQNPIPLDHEMWQVLGQSLGTTDFNPVALATARALAPCGQSVWHRGDG